MSTSNNTSSNGIGFFSILGIVFIILKLTNNIDWSWWWVTAPFWIPLGFATFVLVVLFIVKIVFVSKAKKKFKKFYDNNN